MLTDIQIEIAARKLCRDGKVDPETVVRNVVELIDGVRHLVPKLRWQEVADDIRKRLEIDAAIQYAKKQQHIVENTPRLIKDDPLVRESFAIPDVATYQYGYDPDFPEHPYFVKVFSPEGFVEITATFLEEKDALERFAAYKKYLTA